MVSATLDEPGCHEYAFSPDPNHDDRVMLYELWDDQEALDGHFASTHMADWLEVRSTLQLVSADIEKYIISEVGSVP